MIGAKLSSNITALGKGTRSKVTTKTITLAMNKDTAVGDCSATRDYKNGNMHGVYSNKYQFYKDDVKIVGYSYLATVVPNRKFQIEPTREHFKNS